MNTTLLILGMGLILFLVYIIRDNADKKATSKQYYEYLIKNSDDKWTAKSDPNDFKKKKDVNRIIITSPAPPESYEEEDYSVYLSKINKLSKPDLYVEFNNVMAARHNLMYFHGFGGPEIIENAKILEGIQNKILILCFYIFGEQKIANYAGANGENLKSFFRFLANIDDTVAKQKLNPEEHGKTLIEKINSEL